MIKAGLLIAVVPKAVNKEVCRDMEMMAKM